jgi:deoxyribose-phosphate aldolase
MAVPDLDIDLARYIDHSLLVPTATSEQVAILCEEADRYRFPTVCVYPSAVKPAVQLLHGKKTAVCTVIGFPTGATTSAVKRYEALEAVDNGARELDVVINLGWLKEGKSEELFQEIAAICEDTGKTVKAILETSQLTPTEKRLAAEICMDAGAEYLKTSTGWFGGATVADVKFLAEIARGRASVKASGGIRTVEQALALIEAGATRLGTSRGVELMRSRRKGAGADQRSSEY